MPSSFGLKPNRSPSLFTSLQTQAFLRHRICDIQNVHGQFRSFLSSSDAGEMLTTVKRKMKIGGKHKPTEDKCPSRRMSVMSGIDFDEEFICPRAVVLSSEMITDAHFQDAMPTSPNASTADLLQRANSVDSETSSGFGGSNGYLKLDSDESSCSHQDLLETLDNLRREIDLKDSRIREVEDYLDKLVARVMDHNPELLAGPLVPNGKTGRDVASPFAEHTSVH